ncbi:hypothetical protein, partial [Streptomyces alanosinicus]|uniref:hypothetical protein n=1 Tax=Streptomyces alanosinicus TaxID=68171 RepID=UPI001E4DD5FE
SVLKNSAFSWYSGVLTMRPSPRHGTARHGLVGRRSTRHRVHPLVNDMRPILARGTGRTERAPRSQAAHIQR